MMANFLGNLGAAFRGQQDYQTFLDQQAAAKIRLEADKEKLAEIKDLTAQAKVQRERQPAVDQGVYDYLSQVGIPPPPPSAPQAPAPGQASVPMTQPNAQYGQKPIGPQMGMPPQGQPMPPPQGPPQPPQGPQMAPQGPQAGPPGQAGAPPGQPPVPPYRTVGGPPPPQAGPQGIPPPPPQEPGQPAPNSMSLKDAAQFIKARGITDPTTSIQILEKLTPYLNNEAKQEAAQLKMQMAHMEKQTALQEKAREADQRSKDYNLSVKQREDAAKESSDIRRLAVAVAQQNADTKRAAEGNNSGGAGVGADGKPGPGVEAATWNYLLKNQSPPAKGGLYKQTMAYVEQLAKENKMSVQELTSASADVKTKLQAKKNFEVRAQNMERAENQILAEIPIMESAMKALNLSKIPAFQSGGIAALRAMGDPRVTTLDQAAETVFNEFQGIITGNPGTLNVSDVAQAKHNYESARTQAQMDAALAGMRRIMGNAKKALATTRKDIMQDINNQLSNKENSHGGPTQIKDAADYAKLPSGAEYITPDGQHKRKP